MAISSEVEHRLGDAEVAESFSRQHLANFVWALATLEHDPGGLASVTNPPGTAVWARGCS